MAVVVLAKQLSTDEIIQLLKKGFPNFIFEKKSPFLIECNTGLSGKFDIHVTGGSVNIAPKIPILIVLILVFSVIGILLLVASAKNPNAVAMANYIKENEDDAEIPKNTSLKIPDTCTHCKNPNTKLVRECEWCGNQIIQKNEMS